MQEILLPPLLLGLSAGIYCLGFCVPFVAPVVIAEEREKKGNLFVILKFLLGRFLGYVAFGALFGYLGAKLNVRGVQIILNLALMLLALVLVLHAMGLKKWQSPCLCSKIKKHNKKIPLLMGFLMGVNVCPAFLLSLTYVFTLHSALRGVVYFVMFFFGTSVYFLPLFFLGFLNKYQEFQRIGRLSGVVVGGLFFCYGFYRILTLL